MVSDDDAKRIRAIFLHDGHAVSFNRAARLLGWSTPKMIAAVEARTLAIKQTPSGVRVARSELLFHAAEQWPFSVIEEALGPAADSRLPAGLRMQPLPVPVHKYAADMLEYLAAKGGLSVETLLAQILEAYAVPHLSELVTKVPSCRDAVAMLTEAKIRVAYEPVRRNRRP